MEKVTVIMGVYNVADTLEEALDSLMNQTFQDFKIVMCDDGSGDDTYDIARSYQSRYPSKILLIRNKKNRGLNYTLNHCLKYAKGKYTARMDGDDICTSDRFEKQVKYLDEHPEIAIVSSTMTLFDENGDFRVTKAIQYPQTLDFISGNPFCHAPVMIRTEAYKKVGGYTVDKKMLRVEDVDLWFKLYAAGYKGYNFMEPLYKMRDDREATSRRKFKYRINSTYTRIIGFKRLRIPFYYYPLAFKPVLVGLLPKPIYTILHRLNR